ncbi:MAG: dienelactone hydrolase family protein [Chloroflexota bacterium]|nr:dienelactone hydrolase family protein [Chloroflexota bacterium]
MDWRDVQVVSMGVAERPFYVTRGDEQIPGIVWMPEEPASALPLVLMGHGGQSEKRNAAGLAMARRFVRRHGMAVCAIDAIDHGERGPIRDAGNKTAHPAYIELWKRPDTFDRMNADWTATLDELLASDRFDQTRIGYWGLSMGTILGLPFVASEPRINAAVLGACGFSGPSAVRGRFAERHRRDAPNVTCPVLFMVQWADELFDREGALELFDTIGSHDKRMHVHPGQHGAFPQEAADATREFLAAQLRRGP